MVISKRDASGEKESMKTTAIFVAAERELNCSYNQKC